MWFNVDPFGSGSRCLLMDPDPALLKWSWLKFKAGSGSIRSQRDPEPKGSILNHISWCKMEKSLNLTFIMNCFKDPDPTRPVQIWIRNRWVLHQQFLNLTKGLSLFEQTKAMSTQSNIEEVISWIRSLWASPLCSRSLWLLIDPDLLKLSWWKLGLGRIWIFGRIPDTG